MNSGPGLFSDIGKKAKDALNCRLRYVSAFQIIIVNIGNHHGVEPGKIHLVLEYCKGGDLSMFIQRRQGRIPKSTAVHFMQQLAAGLKVLRENQIIHRDLKPQALLASRRPSAAPTPATH
ncbi:Protein kinase, catalytic domain-containing protein, partial [Cynara cardunculus var. scolymus]